MYNNHDVAKLIALDIDASRVRAASGSPSGQAEPVLLEGDSLDLPTTISLEGRQPQVGTAGMRLLRRLPHLMCHDFLACLGTSRQWNAGRHRWQADDAVRQLLKHLKPVWGQAVGVGLSVPSYLEPQQVQAVAALAREAGVPLRGVTTAALPLAETAYRQSPWSGPALVVEADDHALTWTAVTAEDGEIHRLGSHVLPHLRHTAWREKLLNWVAESCIRQSRRDPRAYPEVEQMLFDQLGRVLATRPQGQILELVIVREQWYHNLLLRFEELARVCAPFVKQAITAMDELMTAFDPPGVPAAVISSWTAGQLPGLVPAVNAIWEQRQMARAALCDPRDEDEPEVRPVTVLPAGAVAETLFAYTRHWLAISPPGDGLVDRVTVPAAPATNNGLKQQPYPAPIA
jgi:hypothetical protein